jgi:hypothetical protein
MKNVKIERSDKLDPDDEDESEPKNESESYPTKKIIEYKITYYIKKFN